MKKHYNLRIEGKVQGVWYRASTKKKAEELGITGFVRNEPNGSVYVEAEGEEAVLSQFVNWCKEGPPHARVEQIHTTEGQIQNFQSFTISQ